MADTDNKVDAPEEDADDVVVDEAALARKEGIWDSLSDEDKARLEGAEESESTPDVEEQPAVTSEEVPMTDAELGQSTVAELQAKLDNLSQRYESSSTEGKRLAAELKKREEKERFLQQRWDMDTLLEGYEEQPSPEDRPITRRELEEMQIQARWEAADERFFTDNKDLNHPVLKRTVKSLLFTEDGMQMRFPDKTPSEAFEEAAREVRQFLAQERLRGKEEVQTVRTEMSKAAIAEGADTGPSAVTEEVDDLADAEYSYIEMWKKRRQQTVGDQ